MNHIQDGYRGVSLLMNLNADRLYFLAVLIGALAAGAWLAHP